MFFQRTRSHKKVSAIAALFVSPDKKNVRLYLRLYPGKNVNTDLVLNFLKALKKQIGQPVVLVWDRLTAHRAKTLKDYLADQSRFDSFFLPPYAPELNPVEYI